MDNNQKIDILFDSAQNLFDVAEQQQDTIKKLIDNVDKNQRLLNSASRSLNETSQHIEQNTIYKVDEKSEEIAQKITKSILVKFEEANQYAEESTQNYQKAAKWSVYQPFLFAVIFYILLVLTTFGYFKYYLPEEVSKLHFEKTMLSNEIKRMKTNIDNLEQLNGKIMVSNCIVPKTKEKRKCVNLDSKWIKTRFGKGPNENYYIIKED